MSALHRASLALAAITTLATLGGCAEDEGRISWVEQAPLEQVANNGYSYSWQVEKLGDEPLEVRYTTLHICPADDTRCRLDKDSETRREGAVLRGNTPGTFEHDYVLPPGQWRVEAHTKLFRHSDCEEEIHRLAMDDVVTVIGVGFDIDPYGPPPAPLEAGVPATVRWRAHPSPSSTQLMVCPAGSDGSNCLTTEGIRVAGSLYEASFTPGEAGEWTLEVRATLEGSDHAVLQATTVH